MEITISIISLIIAVISMITAIFAVVYSKRSAEEAARANNISIHEKLSQQFSLTNEKIENLLKEGKMSEAIQLRSINDRMIIELLHHAYLSADDYGRQKYKNMIFAIAEQNPKEKENWESFWNLVVNGIPENANDDS